jgi:tetratricopeptide (TPR) repeat protein
MKRGIGVALVLAACLLTMQAQQGNSGAAAQNKQTEPPAPQPKPQHGNPFPTDTTDIPVLPSRETPTPNLPANAPTATFDQIEDSHYALSDDSDPVASPDGLNPAANSNGQVSSSNVSSLDSILPQPGEDQTKKGKKGGDEIEDMPKETAAQDISVGKYYLDNRNWRAALSRFQSALVLAPEDPEVYWGLAESQRHMGDFANARANYEKVIEYDPDSKHAKEAAKALKDPQLANAKPVAQTASPQR